MYSEQALDMQHVQPCINTKHNSSVSRPTLSQRVTSALDMLGFCLRT